MPQGDARPQPGFTPRVNRAEVRRVPRAGDRVYIVHLAAWERATVIAVHDKGRRIEVRGDEEGTVLEFALSRATARFVSGGLHGPRLRWATPEDELTGTPEDDSPGER
jgi:hypothetical protein